MASAPPVTAIIAMTFSALAKFAMAVFMSSGNPRESSKMTFHKGLFFSSTASVASKIASRALFPQSAYCPDRGSTHPKVLRSNLLEESVFAGGFTGNDFTSALGIWTGFSSAIAIFEKQREKMTVIRINILPGGR